MKYILITILLSISLISCTNKEENNIQTTNTKEKIQTGTSNIVIDKEKIEEETIKEKTETSSDETTTNSETTTNNEKKEEKSNKTDEDTKELEDEVDDLLNDFIDSLDTYE